jgi:hypothetical protein
MTGAARKASWCVSASCAFELRDNAALVVVVGDAPIPGRPVHAAGGYRRM